MTQAPSRIALANERQTDQQLMYAGISWSQFELIRAVFA